MRLKLRGLAWILLRVDAPFGSRYMPLQGCNDVYKDTDEVMESKGSFCKDDGI